LLIEKAQADKLKDALLKGTKVQLKASLEISHPFAKTVEVSMWYGTALDLPLSLLQELYDY
jgi:hypothetical protein